MCTLTIWCVVNVLIPSNSLTSHMSPFACVCMTFYSCLYNSVLASSCLTFAFLILGNGMLAEMLWHRMPAPLPEWQFKLSLPILSQCHGLWDEDDVTDGGTDKEESDDELSLSHGRRASLDSLKSINLAASVESVHVSFPEQPKAVRRKRSDCSSQISVESSFSSTRSKRGIHFVKLHD